jgi:hypothetical protein
MIIFVRLQTANAPREGGGGDILHSERPGHLRKAFCAHQKKLRLAFKNIFECANTACNSSSWLGLLSYWSKYLVIERAPLPISYLPLSNNSSCGFKQATWKGLSGFHSAKLNSSNQLYDGIIIAWIFSPKRGIYISIVYFHIVIQRWDSPRDPKQAGPILKHIYYKNNQRKKPWNHGKAHDIHGFCIAFG